MKEAIPVILGLAALVAATAYVVMKSEDYSAPTRALEAQGWREVEIRSGTAILSGISGCEGKEIAYEAAGTNPAGKRARAVVCCGAVVKACTVRSR